jgi:hypothetical protein
MHRHPVQRQYLAAAGVARVRVPGSCAMPTAGSWSITPFLAVNPDRKHGWPRRPVTSP